MEWLNSPEHGNVIGKLSPPQKQILRNVLSSIHVDGDARVECVQFSLVFAAITLANELVGADAQPMN